MSSIHSKSQRSTKNNNFDTLKRKPSEYREMSPRDYTDRKILKSNSGKNSKFSIKKLTENFISSLSKGAFNFISRSKSKELRSKMSSDEEEEESRSGTSTPDFKSNKRNLNKSCSGKKSSLSKLVSLSQKSNFGGNGLDERSKNTVDIENEIESGEKKNEMFKKEISIISNAKRDLMKIYGSDNNPVFHYLNIEKARRLQKIGRRSVIIERSKSKLKQRRNRSVYTTSKKNQKEGNRGEEEEIRIRDLEEERRRRRFKRRDDPSFNFDLFQSKITEKLNEIIKGLEEESFFSDEDEL